MKVRYIGSHTPGAQPFTTALWSANLKVFKLQHINIDFSKKTLSFKFHALNNVKFHTKPSSRGPHQFQLPVGCESVSG